MDRRFEPLGALLAETARTLRTSASFTSLFCHRSQSKIELFRTRVPQSPPLPEQPTLQLPKQPVPELPEQPSILKIDDTSSPLYIGKLTKFIRQINSTKSSHWFGFCSYRKFCPLSSGENDNLLVCGKSYHFITRQPVEEDDVTGRVEVALTARVLGRLSIPKCIIAVFSKLEDGSAESSISNTGKQNDAAIEQVEAANKAGLCHSSVTTRTCEALRKFKGTIWGFYSKLLRVLPFNRVSVLFSHMN